MQRARSETLKFTFCERLDLVESRKLVQDVLVFSGPQSCPTPAATAATEAAGGTVDPGRPGPRADVVLSAVAARRNHVVPGEKVRQGERDRAHAHH